MEDIIPFDLQRMLVGDGPPLFLLEIVVRVSVIWLWAILLLRWIGGRSVSQMSVLEFLLVIALGSAVGDPMFQPEVPLLHAMLVILLLVCADKALDHVMRRFARVKAFVDGPPTQVVRDGQILHDGAVARNFGASELMALLRLKDVRNLGEVEQAYVEASGQLSVFRFATPRLGLRIVPPVETRPLPLPSANGLACCTRCGLVGRCVDAGACGGCGHDHWTVAE